MRMFGVGSHGGLDIYQYTHGFKTRYCGCTLYRSPKGCCRATIAYDMQNVLMRVAPETSMVTYWHLDRSVNTEIFARVLRNFELPEINITQQGTIAFHETHNLRYY